MHRHGVRSLAVACGGAQHDPGQSWAGAGGRDRAIVRHRAQLESAARDVAPCTGLEVGTDCIDGLRLIRPRIEARKACCDATTKVPDLMENSVPARPVYVPRGKTHIGAGDEDRTHSTGLMWDSLAEYQSRNCNKAWPRLAYLVPSSGAVDVNHVRIHARDGAVIKDVD